MKLTLAELRKLINENLSGSHPEQAYDGNLVDDPAFEKQSVLVPDDIKQSIKSWLKTMGLSSRKKKRGI